MHTAIASMRAKAKARANGEDAGFTLVEALITVGIIAILLAVAVPLYLGLTGSSKSKNAQTALTAAITTAKAIQADSGLPNYNATLTPATRMQDSEPTYTFTLGTATNGPATGAGFANTIYYFTATGTTQFSVMAMGDNGKCYKITSSTTGPDVRSSQVGNCPATANNHTALTTAGWNA